jgi:hypothetical protein
VSSTAPTEVVTSDRVGLVCDTLVGAVVVPVEFVGQIVEIDVTSPVPLASPFIGGLSSLAHRLLITVRMGPPRKGTFRTKAIILRRESLRLTWCFEVETIGTFVRAKVRDGGSKVDPAARPPWLRDAETIDGSSAFWLDVDGMARWAEGFQ